MDHPIRHSPDGGNWSSCDDNHRFIDIHAHYAGPAIMRANRNGSEPGDLCKVQYRLRY